MSACDKYSSGPAGKPIPDLDPRDKAPCEDPGVAANAAQAAAQNRLAWAVCRRKHQNVVGQYEDVQERFGAQ